jgi:hypothetical protein
MGVLVFAVVAAIVAFACHRWIGHFLLALLISGPLAACVFQVIVTIQLGHADPLFLIALFTTTLAGWVIALIVGLMMRYLPFDPVPKGGATSAADSRDPSPRASGRPGEGVR